MISFPQSGAPDPPATSEAGGGIDFLDDEERTKDEERGWGAFFAYFGRLHVFACHKWQKTRARTDFLPLTKKGKETTCDHAS